MSRHVLWRTEFNDRMRKDAEEMIQWLGDEEGDEEEEEA